MKSIRNIKIKTKLLLLGGVSILGMVFIGAESILTSRQINAASTEISQSWVPAIIIAEELNTETSDYRIKEYYHVITQDDVTMDHLEKEMLQVRKEISAAFEEYERSYISSEADRELMERAEFYWDKYLECSDRLLPISRDNDTKKALEMIIGESRQLFDEASNAFLKMADFNRKGAEAASIRGDELYIKLARIKVVIVLLVCAIVAVLVIYIIVAIDKPVKAILEGTRKVANGDLEVHLPYESEDEIGVVTDSLNQLIAWLRNVIDDEKHLFEEMGNENFKAESNCEKAYKGDFASILYSISGLMKRLEEFEKRKEGIVEETPAPAGLKDIIDRKDKITEVCKEIKKHDSREMDASDKES